MSHFSSDTLYYTPPPMDQQPLSEPFPFFHPSFKPNNVIDIDTTSSTSSTDQEYMFEKPLTPSDVGKLNRLVIPKQHAEKYFPLSDVAGSNGGVLLGFEDETGKCWKFRYSYWNSSQSYVLTKGWSRYVKDKKLYAGDVVLFQRHRVAIDRFFIGWRRRGSSSPRQCVSNPAQQDRPMSYRLQNYMHEGTEVRQGGGQKVIKSGVANSKRVRLFGVNLECQILEEELEGKGEVVIDEEIELSQTTISDGSPSSSHGQGQVYHAGSGFGQGPTTYNFDYMSYPSNHHYNSHMDMNFPQDVNQISNSLR